MRLNVKGLGGFDIPDPAPPGTPAGQAAFGAYAAAPPPGMGPGLGQRPAYNPGRSLRGGPGQLAPSRNAMGAPMVQRQQFNMQNPGGVMPGAMPQFNAVEQARMAQGQRDQMGAAMGNSGNSALAGYMMGR